MNKKLYKLMNWPEIEEIIYADGDAPHRILGAHKVGKERLVQAFFPGAEAAEIHVEKEAASYPMELADEDGFFAALLPLKTEESRYSYHVTFSDGRVEDAYDPYNFPPLIDREDIIQFNSGIHYHIYQKLGAHPMTREHVRGVNFAVWAPSVSRVSVIGDFNGWDGRRHQMTRVDPCGIFELFIPGVKPGAQYQFELRTKGGDVFSKCDPYAFAVRDAEGSVAIVSEELTDAYEWKDAAYMQARRKKSTMHAPLSICELSLDSYAAAFGSESATYGYRDMAKTLPDYLISHGFNALELQPVMEHKVNPFEVTAFFALQGAYGSRTDFMTLIDALHEKNIAVIAEWPPTFFAENPSGLSFYDGQPLYEYGDETKMRQPKSGYLVFDYGRKQVCNYLLSNALYYAVNFHIDGLRFTDISKAIYLDYDRAPGAWHPNVYGGNENLEAIEFIKSINKTMKKFDPGFLMMTKETACWPQVTGTIADGGLQFDYKWNNGWSHDFLQYLRNDPIYRAPHHEELTFGLIYAYAEKYVLAFAHEDAEQGYTTIVDSMPGDTDARFADYRLALTALFTYPGKKMLFLAPDSADDERSAKVTTMVRALNDLYASHPALYERDDDETAFQWVNATDAEHSVLSFLRLGKREKDTLLIVFNFAGVAQDVCIGAPYDGKYHVIFSSDDTAFGGNGEAPTEELFAVRKDIDGREYALKFTLPALSAVVLDFTAYTMKERAIRKIKQETEYQRELEMEESAKALLEAQRKEEEELLQELKKRHEQEIAEQNKAIALKYERIEAEEISKAAAVAPSQVKKKSPSKKKNK